MNAISEHVLRLAEALIFTSETPVPAALLSRQLDPDTDINQLIAALSARHAGRGFELVSVSGGWCFRTAPDLAPYLPALPGLDRRIPRVAMEVLTLIAYEQPVTRVEMEAFRSAAVSQKTLDLLLELDLVQPLGQKQVPGRPMLWGTTAHFLSLFSLQSLEDLPGFNTRVESAAAEDRANCNPTEPPYSA